MSELTPEMARRLGLGRVQGVIISNVKEGSPADQSGLEVGEPLFEINRQPVRSVKEFAEVSSQTNGDALVKTPRGYFVLHESSPKE